MSLWTEEATQNELFSLQLWKKRQNFLDKKRREDLEKAGSPLIKWRHNAQRADECHNWRVQETLT